MRTPEEIAFIDRAVADLETLLAGLRPDVEPILLDPARAAAAQMAEAVRGRDGLLAVHVIAHGAPGEIRFTAGALDAAALRAHAREFAAVGAALGDGGEFLLWSCRTGAGEAGAAFVAGIAAATGAAVGASQGLIGAAARGGAWTLAGTAHARAPLTQQGMESYEGVMSMTVSLDLNGAGAGVNDTTTFTEQNTVLLFGSATIATAGEPESINRLTLTLNGATANESLSLDATGATLASGHGVTVTYNSGTGVLTLAGPGTISDAVWSSLLNHVQYGNTSDAPALSRTVDVVAGSTVYIASASATDSITVTPVNDEPAFSAHTGAAAYTENAAASPLFPLLTVADPDQPGNFSGGSLAVSLSNTVTGDELVLAPGAVTLDGTNVKVSGVTIGTISVGGLDGGDTAVTVSLNASATATAVNALLAAVAYHSTSDDPTAQARTATVVFDDGGNTGGGGQADLASFTISVTPVNDAPVLTGDWLATVAEGGSYLITLADLNYTDPDDSAADVTFTVGSQVNGTVLVNGSAATTFTGQQLADGVVAFQHDGTETLSASFQVSVEDGNEDSSAPVAQTFNLTVTPVNDAPVLTSANPLDAIAEDPSSNPGMLVSALYAATDADGPVTGIAVVGASTTGGQWQYDDGSGWTNFSASPASAFILDASWHVRFVPDLNRQTDTSTSPQTQIAEPGLTFRAWDGTSGSAGDTPDLSSPSAVGGTTAFSAATANSSLTITNVVDRVFTENADTVDLGTLSNDPTIDANWFEDTNFLDAEGGDDSVTLADTGDTLASLYNGQVFHGGAGNDHITGGDASDQIAGDGGDDTLSGNGGTDAAVYAGSVTGYTVGYAQDGNGFVIAFNSVTGEGSDTLDGFEQLRFQNGTPGNPGDDNVLDLADKVQLFDGSGNLIGTFDDLKSAADAANADAGTTFTIRLAAGDVNVGGGQIVIGKDITIDGAGEDVTILHADFNTAGTHNDNSGAMIVVTAGVVGNFSDLTIDGTGQQIAMAIRHFGTGTVEDVHFANIKYSNYLGTGISVRGNGDVDVLNSNFTNIERIGAHFRDAGVVGKFDGNTYTGKGDAAPALDYAAEAGGGAHVEFTNNVVSDNLAVAGDGSTSAAFIVTTYFGAGTTAIITGNTVTNSTAGVAGGYDENDASTITFGAGNDFTSGVGTGVQIVGDVVATGTDNVDGTFDWYGGAGNNAPSGAELADTLRGGDGSDTITGYGGADTLVGEGGNDTLYGGSATSDGSQLDQANYSGSLSSYQVSYDPFQTGDADGRDATVTGGADGTDTLHGVERLQFSDATIDLTQKVFLFDAADHLVGTFGTIQAAVNAAASAAGGDETIKIKDGTYLEQVVVDGTSGTLSGLAIVGESEAGVVIQAPASGLVQTADDAQTGRDLFSVVTVKSASNVTIANLTVNGDEQAGQVVGGGDFDGIAYVNSSGTVQDVTIDEIRDPLTGAGQVSGNQRGNALHVSNASQQAFSLIDSTLTGFQKTGAVIRNADVTLTGNDIATFGTQHVMAQNGIQLSHGTTGDVTGNDFSGFGYDGAGDWAVVGLLVFDGDGLTVSGNSYTGTSSNDVGMYFIDSDGGTIEDNSFATADYGIIDYGTIATPNTVVNSGGNANTYTNVDLVNHYLDLDPATQATVLTPIGSDGTDVYIGGAGSDTLDGRGGDDDLQGNGGFDTLIGGAGADTIDGGESGESYTGTAGEGDTAVYGVALTASAITTNGSGWQVATGGAEGTDALTGVEIVQSTGGRFLLVGNGGYASIQAAVDEAVDGDTILIAAGTWTGAGNANVLVDKAVSIVGKGGAPGDTVIDASGFSYGFNVDMATDKLAGTVLFKNLTVVNAASDGIKSQDQEVLGTLTLDSVHIEDSAYSGLLVAGRQASTSYAQAGVQNVVVTNSVFADNGQAGGNAANIMLFEFDGNATLTNVDASNVVAGPNSAAFGIQIAGFDSTLYDQTGYPPVGSYDVLTPIGTVVFDGVDVTGSYRKTGLYIQGYTDTTGLSFVDSTVNVDSTNPAWDKPVIIDPMADQSPSGEHGTPANANSFFDQSAANGSYNLSGLTVTQIGAQFSELDGTTQADTIVGTNANDQITGFDGADTLSGGAGDDSVVLSAPTDYAGDAIDGGADTDAIHIAGGGSYVLSGTIDNVEAVVIDGAIAANVDLSAQAEGCQITGSSADNSIAGGAGSDTIDGGVGTDTAVYAGTLSAADFSYDSGTNTWTVQAGAEGDDALTHVEKVAAGDPDGGGLSTGDYLLVDLQGSYTTIQAAIDAAADGDTILVAAGTYHENVVVNKQVTIIGLGDGDDVVIEGTFKTGNGISGSVADYLKTAPSYSGAAGAGITVAADNVTIKSLKIDSFNTGIEYGGGIEHVTIDGVTIEATVNGMRKGTAAVVSDLNVLGGEIRDSYIGINFATNGVGLVDDLTIDGTAFNHLTQKGIYTETLSHSLITNITMNDVGQYGGGPAFGANGLHGNGIDINLKYENYTDITIDSFNFTNVGLSNGLGTPHGNGAAIAIKARDDAPSYNGDPASYTGSVVIQNGTIDGTSTGIRAGEFGKNIADPDLTITNVSITNEVHDGNHGDITNVTQSTTTVNLRDGGDSMITSPTTTGTMIVTGGDGADTIATGGGADTISGKDGADVLTGGGGNDLIFGGDAASDASSADKAVFSGNVAASAVSYDMDQVIDGDGVDVTVSGPNGSDTLHGVEQLQFADGTVDLAANVLVFSSFDAGTNSGTIKGSYASIADALAAGGTVDGDVIVARAGTYAGNLSIGKGVSILGAQHGVQGTSHTGVADGAGETNIEGLWTIATASSVTIDGLRFVNVSPEGVGSDATLAINSAGAATQHQVLNSVFYSAVDGGDRYPSSNPPDADPVRDDRAFYIGMGASDGSILIQDNYVTGAMTGKYGTASWGRSIWADLNGVDLTVDGNTFEYTRTGLNFDRYAGGDPVISDNTFKDAGTAIALGVGWPTSPNPLVNMTGSVMNNVDLEFNFQNLSTPITFDMGATIASYTDGTVEANPIEDFVHLTASSAGDIITGSSYADAVEARGGNDSVSAGAGNDYIDGGAGADTLRGGADNDYLIGGTGSIGVGNAYTGDAAAFSGARGAYTITQGAGHVYTATGADGSDTLTGIEGMTFDGTPGITFELDANSPTYATAVTRFNQSFSADTAGIIDNPADPTAGEAVRTADGGWHGVNSADGDGYAVFTQGPDTNNPPGNPNDSGPFTRFDGYRAEFNGGWTASVAVYLDPTLIATGEGFDVSVASSNSAGNHLRDFIFHVAHDSSTGELLVGADNNTNFQPREDLETINHADLSTAGWYTFEWRFYSGENNALEVAMNVYDAAGNWKFTEVRNDGADLISTIGGNRYMLFTNIDVANGIAVDDVTLQTLDTNPVQLVKGTGPQLPSASASTVIDSFADIQGAIDAAQSGNIIDLAAKDYGSETPHVDVDNLTFRGSAGALNVDLTLDTGATTVSLDGAAAIDVAGNGGANVINGNAGANTLDGAGGDDTLTGAGGNDALIGAGGTDVAQYAATIAASNVVVDGGGWKVTAGAEGTDTLGDVEVVDGAGGKTLLVGNGGFDTLADAVAYANADLSGEAITILVAGGPYTESVTITRNDVTLLSVDGTTVLDGAGSGWGGVINVAADHVQIGAAGHGFTINNGARTQGVYVQTGASDVDIVGNAVTAGAGQNAILTDGGVSDVAIIGNSLTGGAGSQVVYINGATSLGLANASSNVNILDNSFHGNVAGGVLLGVESDNGSVQGNHFDGASTYAALELWGADNDVTGNPNDFTGFTGPVDIRSQHDDVDLNDFTGADTAAANDLAPAQPVALAGTAAANTLTGNSAGNVIGGGAGDDTLDGGGGNDTITGGANDDTIDGGDGTDTAVYAGTLSAGDFHFDTVNHRWVVNATAGGEGTDTLDGIEKVTDGAGHTFLLVDPYGSYTSIQAAIEAAPAGASILIAGGTYTESGSDGIGHTVGLYIDKPNLTLQGYSAADGTMITSAAEAKLNGPTVISGHETGFGANHWVDVGGTNTVIQGLHLQAGPETTNKLLEIWADNVTVENNFLDVNIGGTTYSYAAAIYLNDNGTTANDVISSYTIDHNVLNEGIIVANGVGTPGTIGANQQITNNSFEGIFDYNTGEGRYDTIVVNGEVNGIGWLLEPTQTPTISGNSFANNTTPFLLRGSDNNIANLPTSAQIAAILANNGDANTSYAYVVDTTTGELVTALRNDGPGDYHSFAVTNTIDTLNLALDTTGDAVFGGQRFYMHNGDTVVVQSGATGAVNSQIMVENLTVKATVNSADLNLTLATTLSDTTPISGGGVHDVTLADYALGQGADVDVTGNALDNTITGNSGNNTLSGAGGNDTLHGGGGNDALHGGGDTDTATYDGSRADYVVVTATDGNGFVTGFDHVIETTVQGTDEGHDTLTDVEVLQFGDVTYDLTKPIQVFDASDELVGTFDSVQAAVNAADPGYTVLINGGTYHEHVTVSEGITLKGLGAVTIDGGAGGPAITVTGSGSALVVDGIDLTGSATYVMLVQGGATYGSVVFKNGDVTGGAYAGFFLDHATGVSAVSIENAQFSGAAPVDSLSSGESEIYFYQYDGTVTLKNVTVAGPGSATGLEYGISLVGNNAPMGTVSFENVDVTGTYAKAGVAVYNFSDLSGLTFVGASPALDVNVNAGWAGVNFDDVGSLDLSSAPISVTNSNAAPGAFDIDFQGTGGSETFTGNGADNFFNGKGGADTLTGGPGNDVFLHVIGGGADAIDGGGETLADVVLVAGQGAFTPVPVTANETAAVQLDGASHVTQIAGATLADVEAVVLDMGGGVDTLDYGGNTQAVAVDLTAGTATGFSPVPPVPAIAGVENVIGGSAGDALSGDGGANTLTGGAGGDVIDGNGGTDTAVYSGNWADYTISYNSGTDTYTVQDDRGGSPDGTDTVTEVENFAFADVTLAAGDALNAPPTLLAATDVDETIAEAASGTQNLATAGSFTATDVNVSDILSAAAGSAIVGGDTGSLSGATLAALEAGLTLLPVPVYNPVTNVLTVDWSYAVNGVDLNGLGEGQQITLTFPVTVTDLAGASFVQDVVITIDGANDGPVLSDTTNPAAVTEAGDASAQDLTAITGSFAVSDLDVGDTLTPSVVGSPVVELNGGSFALPAGAVALIAGGALALAPTTSTGGTVSIAYTYDPGAADLDFLGEGDSLTITYTVKVNDGTDNSLTQDVTFTITGTNDGPVLSDATDPVAVPEAGDASAQDLAAIAGSFDVSDLDVGDALTPSVVGSPVVELNGGGFTLPSGAAALTAGGAFQLTGAASNGGTVGIGYTYDPGAANLDFLRAGDSLTITYTVQVGDGTTTSATQDVTFTITGTNDAPVLSDTTNPAAVQELGNASAQDIAPITGSFPVSDLDVGDTLSPSVVGSPVVQLNGGSFALPGGAAALTAGGAFALTPTTSNGGAASIGYSYDPGAADLDFLQAGDSLTITYTVQVGDGTAISATQDVTITITGTNDAPVFTNAVASTNVAENSTTVYDFAATDVDNGPSAPQFAIAGGADQARFVVDQNTGVLSFVAAPDYEAPADAGADNVYNIDVSVTDGSATTTTSLAVNVTNVAGVTIVDDDAGHLLDATTGEEDIVYANGGDDTVFAKGGNDWIDGGAGNDILYGEAGLDTIYGGIGNDTIDGGAGADQLYGGGGNDVFYLDNAGDTVTELFNDGTDEVRTTNAIQSLSANVENLTGLLGTGQRLVGNTLANAVTGGAGNDQLVGDDGNDTLGGGGGNDALNGGNGDDSISGGDNDDYLMGGIGSDTLNGDGGNDAIDGGAGNDVINGGTGADSLRGNGGDDTYFIDNAGDAVSEAVNDGTDQVFSTNATQFLWANVENLTGLLGTGQRLGGNTIANVITGAGGNDIITGDAGNDTIYGGGGNDTINGNDDDDTIYGGLGADYLLGSGGNDTLYGEEGSDTFDGGNGNDYIDGGTGADSMRGNGGDDIYIVDTISDAITEQLNEGVDEVRTYNASQTLGTNVEKLTGLLNSGQTLTGNALGNTITGGGGNDTISGLDGNDFLYGGGGNDVIDGGIGLDAMYGGDGSDIYYLDNASDVVVEVSGQGVDEVRSTNATQFLAANVENLTGLSSAGQRLGGNALDNVISGNSGNDTITGDAGNDTISGGGGNDAVNGNDGNDVIRGGSGSDFLTGGLGNDIFAFGTTDFQVGVNDTIADFHEIPGTDYDILRLQGTAADYTFSNVAGTVHVIDNATGGFIVISATTIVTIADQIEYVSSL